MDSRGFLTGSTAAALASAFTAQASDITLLLDGDVNGGAGPGHLRLTAIDGYIVTADRNLITSEAPIISNRIDDQPFDRRNKRPLWAVFPYDHATKFRSETIFPKAYGSLSRLQFWLNKK